MTRLRLGPAITRPAARIHDGGAALGRRYGRWLWPANEDQQSLVRLARRLAGTGAVVYLGGIAVQDSPGLLWPATAGGLVAAWRAGRGDTAGGGQEAEPSEDGAAKEEPGEQSDDTSEEEPEPPSPEELRAALIDTLLRIIGAANGIHLRTLYPRLREQPGMGARTDAQLRAVLDHYGIPVERSLSVGGVGGRTGIRRDALMTLRQAAPPEPPKEAESGHSSSALGPSDLRESRPPRAGFSATLGRILGPSRHPQKGPSDLDAHVDDALDLIRPTR